MDQTDFAIPMISGILILMVIFLYLLFKIFEKNRTNRSIVPLLPEITNVELYESSPGKLAIGQQEIKGLEKKIQLARDFQMMESGKEIIMEKKEDLTFNEPGKKMGSLKKTMQIQKDTDEPWKGSNWPIKEETVSLPLNQSIEENEKLKLEDFLVEVREVNTKKKMKPALSLTEPKKKVFSSKNFEKVDKLGEKENPEKMPNKRPAGKKSEKHLVPENVSKGSEEKLTQKRPGKKVSTKKKKHAILNEKPGSGEI